MEDEAARPRFTPFSETRRLLDAAFDLRERLEEANLRRPAPGARRRQSLAEADEALARLRMYLRLASRSPTAERRPLLG